MIVADNITILINQKVLFQPVSFKINKGDFLCIYGANGIGKTSLINAIRSQAFDVGHFTSNLAISDIALLICDQSGLSNLTVNEHLNYISSISSVNDLQFNHVKQRISLLNIRDVYFRDLSRGQLQLCQLYFLSCFKVKLWLLDEPCCHLDHSSCEAFFNICHSYQQAGGSIIMTSHKKELANSIKLMECV